MLLVVDVNAVFSALCSKGVSYEVFALNSTHKYFEFVAPEYAFLELENNMDWLLSQSWLQPEEVSRLLEFIKENIKVIPAEEFREQLPEAFRILEKHHKDAPYRALALKLDCKILSGDKTLKGLCPGKVVTPRKALDDILSNKAT
jgi:predicted nucleic acid-binding protein